MVLLRVRVRRRVLSRFERVLEGLPRDPFSFDQVENSFPAARNDERTRVTQRSETPGSGEDPGTFPADQGITPRDQFSPDFPRRH